MNRSILIIAFLIFKYAVVSADGGKFANFQRTLKQHREKESKLESCDMEKENICDLSSEDMYKRVNGECQQKKCLYQPTIGLSQHPNSPYFKYYPHAIVASSKKILYNFKGMEGEVCTLKNEPCSCRKEDKCTCDTASKVCKQQYRVEKTYFVVYNAVKNTYSSQFGVPANNGPQGAPGSIYAQGQMHPYGPHVSHLNALMPNYQSSLGFQQYAAPFVSQKASPFTSQIPQFTPDSSVQQAWHGRSLKTDIGDEKHKDNDEQGDGKKRRFPSFANRPPNSPFSQELIDENPMQTFKQLVQSLRMNGPNAGFPKGGMPYHAQATGKFGPSPIYNLHQSDFPGQHPFHQGNYAYTLPMQQYSDGQSQSYMQSQDDRSPNSGSPFINRPTDQQAAYDIPEQSVSQPHHNPVSFSDQENYFPQQPQMHYPTYTQQHIPMPHSSFHKQQQPSTISGSAMLNSAMFRYFLMQDKATTTSNAFLKLLPLLMGSKEFSKMISFESLFVMVPDGCKCDRREITQSATTNAKSPFGAFLQQFRPAISQFPGYSMPFQQQNFISPPMPGLHFTSPFSIPYQPGFQMNAHVPYSPSYPFGGFAMPGHSGMDSYRSKEERDEENE